MKTMLALLAVVTVAVSANAQGTIHFTTSLSGANEVPPNGSPYSGSAFFDLDGTTLNYGVTMFNPAPQPTGAFIHGPAGSGTNAPMLFDLGTSVFEPPFPPSPGGWTFAGGILNLTSSQISDLTSGLWYVNVTSTDFPGGELRGQIVAVPEPTVTSLLAMGAAGVWFLRKRIR